MFTFIPQKTSSGAATGRFEQRKQLSGEALRPAHSLAESLDPPFPEDGENHKSAGQKTRAFPHGGFSGPVGSVMELVPHVDLVDQNLMFVIEQLSGEAVVHAQPI